MNKFVYTKDKNLITAKEIESGFFLKKIYISDINKPIQLNVINLIGEVLYDHEKKWESKKEKNTNTKEKR